MNSAFSFGWLYDYGDGLISMPFVLVGFTGGLTDEGFPGDVCGDLRVAVTVSNPADYGIRVNGDCIAGINIAEYDWVSVRENCYIGIFSPACESGSGKTFLGKDTDTDEAYTVVTVLGEGKDVFGFYGDGFTGFQMIDNDMLSIVGIICNGISV